MGRLVHNDSERVQKAGGEEEGDTGVSQTSLGVSSLAAGLSFDFLLCEMSVEWWPSEAAAGRHVVTNTK